MLFFKKPVNKNVNHPTKEVKMINFPKEQHVALIIGRPTEKNRLRKLIVIPEELSIEIQMKKIGGRVALDPEKIRNSDGLTTPKTIYTVNDVEDGSGTARMNPLKCRQYFPKYGRRGLTVYEGIGLLREKPEIFKRSGALYLVGSHYVSPEKVPVIYNSDKLTLDWDWIDDPYARANAGSKIPSCEPFSERLT